VAVGASLGLPAALGMRPQRRRPGAWRRGPRGWRRRWWSPRGRWSADRCEPGDATWGSTWGAEPRRRCGRGQQPRHVGAV